MTSLSPRPEAIEQILSDLKDGDGPIRMINLLRFSEWADYEDENEPAIANGAISGAEAYRIYGEAAGAEVAKVGGSQFYSAKVHQTVIAPDDEEWDLALIVEYPNRSAFLTMAGSPEYQSIAHHRTAALADSRLIMTTGF